jgi:MFS family permease
VPLLVLSYLAFASIALPDGLLGVAWPSMSGSLGQPVSALGWLLPFGVASALLSSASSGFVLARVGLGRLLTASTGVSVLALVGYGTASSFWMVIVATVLLAAGSGAIDAGLNAYAARNFTSRYITWMHASYGLGATVGPILITATLGLGLSWRWAYGFIAALQALIALAFTMTSRAWESGDARPAAAAAPRSKGSGPSLRRVLGISGVWRGMGMFFLQNGVENSTALWVFVYLTSGRRMAAGPASVTVSVYWATQGAGRLILGPVADRYGSHRVMTFGFAGVVLAGVLLVVSTGPALAVVAVILLGLSAAPVYPLLMLTTKERTGAGYADQAIGLQAAASSIGAASIPAAVGVLIAHAGARAFGPCILVITLIATATFLLSTSARYAVAPSDSSSAPEASEATEAVGTTGATDGR